MLDVTYVVQRMTTGQRVAEINILDAKREEVVSLFFVNHYALQYEFLYKITS